MDPDAFDAYGRYKDAPEPPWALFPPESCFLAVCQCPNCVMKVSKLKDFEQGLVSKYCQVNRPLSCRTDIRDKIVHYAFTMASCRSLWALLVHFLKEEIGIPPPHYSSSIRKVNYCYRQIITIMAAAGLADLPEPDRFELDETDFRWTDVKREISRALRLFNGDSIAPQVSSKACPILNHVLALQYSHEDAKKVAAKDGIVLDPALSGCFFLSQQIEHALKLPIEELVHEFEKSMDEFRSFDQYLSKSSEAEKEIHAISHTMTTMNDEFWRTYLSSFDKGLKGHNSTGLEYVLVNLCAEVDKFESHWKKKYAHSSSIPHVGLSRKKQQKHKKSSRKK